MQTNFSLAQLADSDTAESEKILRNCVHCGFCTATCPTYVLLGDELDSPRGRIYLVKQVLEGAQPTVSSRRHLDRCLTCHGSSLAPDVAAQISDLYPQDRAVGFEAGDLRGVFWLEFPADTP